MAVPINRRLGALHLGLEEFPSDAKLPRTVGTVFNAILELVRASWGDDPVVKVVKDYGPGGGIYTSAEMRTLVGQLREVVGGN